MVCVYPVTHICRGGCECPVSPCGNQDNFQELIPFFRVCMMVLDQMSYFTAPWYSFTQLAQASYPFLLTAWQVECQLYLNPQQAGLHTAGPGACSPFL